MKIGIVLHPFGEEHPAGLARTILELAKGLISLKTEHEFIIYVKDKPRLALDFPPGNWRVQALGGGRLWLERLCRAERADVYLFNTPVLPVAKKPGPAVVIALDFAYWLLPARSWSARWRRLATYGYHWLSLKRADRVIAISQATKDDLKRFFHARPERVDVVYCGYRRISRIPEIPVAAPEHFFLFVGVVKERKNVRRVVRAFAAVADKLPAMQLVIGGHAAGEYAESIRQFIEDKRLEHRVTWLGHLNDGQLSYLYKRATALVFPSLIEGFGFPVLEAMDAGLPVITSRGSSLGEIALDSAWLVDPLDEGDIARALSRLASDPALREKLRERGLARASQFSWEKAARETLDILERAGGK
ncbi:MAG: Glycosyl transferase group 1 [Candidatus Magasanikbacteria bacterium GW2011_GWA2_56_11]|uniref:Glycosyl transferase group 1 n=1 Tax=Candidatus Magasanikbacteria bacterium GW2011_GWA2_56_11 TaxID=1619044 RepID=A0A0G1YF54_9BACT|nr:MAG: Glycosyl transferase group 1 [Candidatus Magasanikbacteria bacterium GW2011_GWA2_56_11]